eukprot:4475362-Heterocapsa_arctica.AAC.1
MLNLPRVWGWKRLGSGFLDSTGTKSRWDSGSLGSGGDPLSRQTWERTALFPGGGGTPWEP